MDRQSADGELVGIRNQLQEVSAFEWAASPEIRQLVVYAQGPVSAEKLKKTVPTQLTPDILQPQLDEISRIASEATQKIEGLAEWAINPTAWWQEDAVGGLLSVGIVNDDPFIERIYQEVYVRLYKKANPEAKARELPPVDLKPLHHMRPRKELEEDKERLERELFQARLHLAGLAAAIQKRRHAGAPSRHPLLLRMLVLAAVLGILFPLSVLTLGAQVLIEGLRVLKWHIAGGLLRAGILLAVVVSFAGVFKGLISVEEEPAETVGNGTSSPGAKSEGA